jgi:hypothetical protein
MTPMLDMKITKKRMLAHIISSLTRDRLEEFRQYTQELETKFNIDKNKLSAAHDERIKNLTEQEIMEAGEYFYEDFHIIDEIYIGMYRKATLVSLDSFLENSLNILCRNLCSINNYSIMLEDLKDKGIIRAKNYLKKIAKIDFSQLNGEWGNLQSLRILRNCIVHCEGNIKLSGSKAKLQNIINNNCGLSLKYERDIQIERGYIDFSITQMENFLEKLFRQAFQE